GAGLTLLGTIGLLRLGSFYERIHAPTLGTSWGTGAIVMASMLLFTVIGGRPVLHEFLLGLFLTVTTPVTLTLLARAALYRDRAENRPDVPLLGTGASRRVAGAGDDPDEPPAPGGEAGRGR